MKRIIVHVSALTFALCLLVGPATAGCNIEEIAQTRYWITRYPDLYRKSVIELRDTLTVLDTIIFDVNQNAEGRIHALIPEFHIKLDKLVRKNPKIKELAEYGCMKDYCTIDLYSKILLSKFRKQLDDIASKVDDPDVKKFEAKGVSLHKDLEGNEKFELKGEAGKSLEEFKQRLTKIAAEPEKITRDPYAPPEKSKYIWLYSILASIGFIAVFAGAMTYLIRLVDKKKAVDQAKTAKKAEEEGENSPPKGG